MNAGDESGLTTPASMPGLLEAVIESAPVAIIITDADGRIRLANRDADVLFGYSRDELLGRQVDMLLPRPLQAGHANLRHSFVAKPAARRMGTGRELFGLRKDGAQVPIEIALTPVDSADGMFVVSVIVDTTQRRRLERRFENAVESAPMAMVMVDRDGRIVLVNRELERLFGYERQELLGSPVEVLVPERLRPSDPKARDAFFRLQIPRHLGIGREYYGLRKDGGEIPIEVGVNRVETDEGVFFLSGIVDVTERKRLEAIVRRAHEELEQRVHARTAELESANREKELLLADLRAKQVELDRLSREDPLTHLSNRRDFDQRLDAEIQRALRQHTPLTIAMLDLDHFKRVNDRFGHALGDAVLREVGDLIRHECRAIDVIGRYGGEEFALAVPGTDLRSAVILCERIRGAFETFDWTRLHPELAVTVSAGVSAWRPGLDAQAVLAAADANLYEAKRQGRNRVVPGPG